MMTAALKEALHQPRQLGIRVRLAGPIADTTVDDIASLRRLVSRHGVICIDGQPLTAAQLHAFVSRWGDVIELPAGLAFHHQEPGLPSITRVGNVRPDGSIIPGVRAAEFWHHDGDFWAPGQNFILNFMSSVCVPPVGGRTGFLDMRLAFETLADAERAELEGAFVWVRAGEIDDFKGASPEELPPDVRHPVLLSHPLTHQLALYLPDSPTGIQKEPARRPREVRALVDAMCQRVGVVEHAWAAGDLLIVDNLQVMHRSMGDYGDHPRLLYRCQARCA